MEQSSEIFVGIDVSKARNAITVATAVATASAFCWRSGFVARKAIPSLNKPLILDPCEYVFALDNIIAFDNSGTGKTLVCLALGLAACQRELCVAFNTAAGLVHSIDEQRLVRLQAQIAAFKLC